MTQELRRVTIASGPLQVLDQGTGPIVLCVHGFPLDHSMWREQVAGLSDVARWIVPDLRGFGGSGPVGTQQLTMDSLADDLNQLLDALGVDSPIFLCGLSMGGYVAWQFWERYRSRLRGLILCDTRAAADTEAVARGRRYLAERVLQEGSQAVGAEMLPKLFAQQTRDERPELTRSTLDVIHRTAPATVAAALLGMADRPDMTPRLREVECPVLVICGVEDVITPLSEMQAMTEQLPQGRCVPIPAAGHLAPLERPAVVNPAIRAFVQD